MGETRAPYPEGLGREAVALVRSGGRTIPQFSKSLGISDQTLGNWVRQAGVDVGRREVLSSEEREELRRLRREVRALRQEKEVLARASAFFARESGGR